MTVPILAGTDFPHLFGEMDDHYGGCLFDRTSMLLRNALQVHARAEQVRIPGEEYHETSPLSKVRIS